MCSDFLKPGCQEDLQQLESPLSRYELQAWQNYQLILLMYSPILILLPLPLIRYGVAFKGSAGFKEQHLSPFRQKLERRLFSFFRKLLHAILAPMDKQRAYECYQDCKDRLVGAICLGMIFSVFMLLSMSIKLNWCFNDGHGRFWMVEDPESECVWYLGFPASRSQNAQKWAIHIFGWIVIIVIVFVFPRTICQKIGAIVRFQKWGDEHEANKYGDFYADFKLNNGRRIYFFLCQHLLCDVLLASFEVHRHTNRAKLAP